MDTAQSPDIVGETVRELRSEAIRTNERRLIVCSGEYKACQTAAKTALQVGSFSGSVVSISDREIVGTRVNPSRTAELLGTTHDCIVVDCHGPWEPNTLGQAIGAVDGGGLAIVLTPPLETWPGRQGHLEEMLTAPPFGTDSVGDRFKQRLVRTLCAHRGIAIIDIDSGDRIKHGRTDPAPRQRQARVRPPENHAFPQSVYASCLTTDQRDAVYACERLTESGSAIVLEADRGRGKSSAAGMAAAALAADGTDILVTAPTYRNAAQLFERATETLKSLKALESDDRDGSTRPEIRTTAGGRIRFRKPTEATEISPDVLFVDEAAALPVHVLETLLSVSRSICFTTTVRGYEGAGRGFDIRFRERLSENRSVTAVTLSEPIRYAAADPIEVWLFHALLLGATPPPSSLVEGFSPAEAAYERIDRTSLAADEARLREMFGLLVAAHYRTEPNDLARLLDAPNVAIRALTINGHVVSIALLGREGGLDGSTRRVAYEGDRIDGNLVPDLLTSQLRDPDAGIPVGLRVMRIATHHALRSCGFGSRLLKEVEAEFEPAGSNEDDRLGAIDYLATSYGTTPGLLGFWSKNGYRSVHLSTTRNDTSGEHSAVMLRPLSAAGRDLARRHDGWFRRRLPDVLAGSLDSVDPDVVRGVLDSIKGSDPIALSEFEWRLVASAANGPGRYATAPGPFRRLAYAALLDGAVDDPDAERLLVVKALQDRPWNETAETLGYVSERACMRAFGDAYEPIVDTYGSDLARTESDRYRS